MLLRPLTFASLLLAGTVLPARADVSIDDLKPGLVAVYKDLATPPVEIVRVEPTVGFTWKAGEAAHPRLAAEGGSVTWEGFLNVLRPGEYRFSATVLGKVQVNVAGKDVLVAQSKGDKPTPVEGTPLRLEGGPQALKITFTRPAGPARLELLWHASYFRTEPLPYDALFHLPAKVPAGLATTSTLERGRWLVEENNCAGCHKPDAADKLARTLQGRMGPDLSLVGSRVQPDWLVSWLTDPHKMTATAAMPKLFADNESAEVYAVARYLASLGAPPKPAPKPANPKEVQTSVNSGQRLFVSLGCLTCHDNRPEAQKGAQQAASAVPLRRNFLLPEMGHKTTADQLIPFLLDPLKVDPSGRMPHMLLETKDATDLARYLCDAKQPTPAAPAVPTDTAREAAYKKLKPADADLATFTKLPAEEQWKSLGQRLVVERGCTNCHNIGAAGKTLASQPSKVTFDSLKAGKGLAAGCLVDDAPKPGAAPAFALSDPDRKAVRAFLTEGSKGAGSPAPTHAARLTLHRFNCFACHTRNGKGGLNPDVVEEIRRFEKAENAEAVMPPPLTGVGHKLRTPWLARVLTDRARARPWMALRMPHFGPSVAPLAEALAALEGARMTPSISRPSPAPSSRPASTSSARTPSAASPATTWPASPTPARAAPTWPA